MIVYYAILRRELLPPVFTFSDEILAKIIFTTLGGFRPGTVRALKP